MSQASRPGSPAGLVPRVARAGATSNALAGTTAALAAARAPSRREVPRP